MISKGELTTTQSPQSDTECAEARTIPYQNATGSLLYAAMATWPDIAFAVRVLCRFNSKSSVTFNNELSHTHHDCIHKDLWLVLE